MEWLDLEREWPEAAETLEDFNERFYVVENFGGKCHVCCEDRSPVFTNCFDFTHQSFEEFRKRFSHQLIKVGEDKKNKPIYVDRGSFWLHHRDRRQYSQIIYAPGQPLPPDMRNLWRGFAYEPKKGDCSLYLAHLKDNVCQGKQERYDWLIGWMAHSVRATRTNKGTLVLSSSVGKASEKIPPLTRSRISGARIT